MTLYSPSANYSDHMNRTIERDREKSFREKSLDRFFENLSPVTGLAEWTVRNFLLSFVKAEPAHDWALKFLPVAAATRYRQFRPDDARLAQTMFGMKFVNPIGVAAGVDKDAQQAETLLRCGFGFVEVGTVTPVSQPGNPGPRVFRLRGDKAIVNRFGFNSAGSDAMLARLHDLSNAKGPIGVNVGANKDSASRESDYIFLIKKFGLVADYITINISSPNTPGLRALQSLSAFDALIARAIDARDSVRDRPSKLPVLVKIAPDLYRDELDGIIRVARTRRLDGIIVSNTTTSRPAELVSRKKIEVGGLSGRPLFSLSTKMLAEVFLRTENAFPIIGAGGIESGAAALAKIRAGASLIQLYTGLVFRGLNLVSEMKQSIVDGIEAEGKKSVSDLVGLDASSIVCQVSQH